MSRAARDIVVGAIVAVIVAVIATALVARSFEREPTLSKDGAGAQVDATDTSDDTPTGVVRSPNTAAQRLLVRVYEPFDIARESTAGYSIVTLPQLGAQFPTIGFVPGDHLAQHTNEVSVLMPTPAALTLATPDAATCTFLREVGAGLEIAEVPGLGDCRASRAPLDGWYPISPA